MFGVHIGTPDSEHAGPGTSDFEMLFGFLIPKMPAYSWLIDGYGYAPFLWPGEWLLTARLEEIEAQAEETPDGIIVDTEFLSRYMKYFSDDWIDIYGFADRAVDLSRWTEERFLLNGCEYVLETPESADVVFRNVDGCFWQLFAKPPHFINEVLQRWPEAKVIQPR